MLKEKWQKMPLAEQLANTGSAAIRALHYKERADHGAMERLKETLELFDLTISDKRWRFKIKEIFKMRSVFCDTFFNLGNFKVSQENIEEYFIPFAVLANKQYGTKRIKK